MAEHARAIYLYSATAAAPESESVSPEELLLEQACAGDEDAFNQIYRSYAPMVHGILLARVPYDDVKDLVQEVFLSAYKHLDTVREPKALGGCREKPVLTDEEKYAYGQLMLALSITSSKWQVVQDSINGVEDDPTNDR